MTHRAAIEQQLGGRRVPQNVRRNPLRDPGQDSAMSERSPNVGSAQPRLAGLRGENSGVGVGSRLQVEFDPLQRAAGKEGNALLVAFADDSGFAGGKVDLVAVERQCLRNAHGASEQCFHQGAKASARQNQAAVHVVNPDRADEALDLGGGQIDDVAPNSIGERDVLGIHGSEPALGAGECQQSFERRQNADLATDAQAARQHVGLEPQHVLSAIADYGSVAKYAANLAQTIPVLIQRLLRQTQLGSGVAQERLDKLGQRRLL